VLGSSAQGTKQSAGVFRPTDPATEADYEVDKSPWQVQRFPFTHDRSAGVFSRCLNQDTVGKFKVSPAGLPRGKLGKPIGMAAPS